MALSGKERKKNEKESDKAESDVLPFSFLVPRTGTLSNQLMTILRRICELSGLFVEKLE